MAEKNSISKNKKTKQKFNTIKLEDALEIG